MNKYDTEMNYYNSNSLNKENCSNLYKGTFHFRKTENISLSQQTNIVNNITEPNNQTIHYIVDNFLDTDSIATIELNPDSELLKQLYMDT